MPETSPEKRGIEETRRSVLTALTIVGAAGATGVSLTAPRAYAVPAKLPPDQVHYQATPNGDARCELCANWQAPGACKLVAGPISPSGWCSLFAKKS